MLVTSKEVLNNAKKGKYAIIAPDFIDLNSARVFVQTAEEMNRPIILSYAQAHEDQLSLDEAAAIGKVLANSVKVPIVLHLDHGTDVETIKKAIDLGFTSVMIDASTENLEENIRRTKEVVDYAHPRGVVVEAEIGHVGSGYNYENHNNSDSIYTDVEEAKYFVKETNVDSLAVSIGTAHGLYKGEPSINFEVLHKLQEAISIPLVLHGGSGSGNDNLRRCAQEGISKINIFTDFMTAAYESIQKDKPKDYFEIKRSADEGMKSVIKHYFKVFSKEEL